MLHNYFLEYSHICELKRGIKDKFKILGYSKLHSSHLRLVSWRDGSDCADFAPVMKPTKCSLIGLGAYEVLILVT